ncbi:hypothetical protein [Roseateles koreensis]|uniref:PLD phosphodiesterase domain-containing protein n=1 Tax=Roseateles koreensis TaxID=2987526 RepID=A0ABT5KU15_9BURK|nr:hypothetical protein [Roseateles koreensis]MDC8785316.1 hypothetical protein [Roseateles koreensis]
MSAHPDVITPHRTVTQIIGKDGVPLTATFSSNLWHGAESRFADKSEGNKIKAFVTGKDYFADLLVSIKSASQEICMAGWQINWDALLAPGVRLYDALYAAAAANKGLQIYVMPWDDTQPVQTYALETKRALEDINDRLNSKQVHVLLSPSYASVNNRYFSHHQKQIIIDRTLAYVGGMDVCYGRYEDTEFRLKADWEKRMGMNRYNPCIESIGKLEEALTVDPDLMTGGLDHLPFTGKGWSSTATLHTDRLRQGGWQAKYAEAPSRDVVVNASALATNKVDLSTLEAYKQPRMPWNDVHCRIEGPAVNDLLRNFVGRWLIQDDKANLFAPVKSNAAECTQAKPGQAHIQVLRSAPQNHCAKEVAALKAHQPATAHPDLLAQEQALLKTLAEPRAPQKDIYTTMLRLIEKASHFIYIENQFFVGEMGQVQTTTPQLSAVGQFINRYGGKNQNSGGRTAARTDRNTQWQQYAAVIAERPQNGICQALVTRIRRAIMNKTRPRFHVYLTLPVHPEGCLNNATIAIQVFWTMQTLTFGSQSLLNGIRRSLKARELRDGGDTGYERVYADGNDEYESVDTERCFEYVTLLNLRTWDTTMNQRAVTEQIYVHSKLMIVDDLYALLGSANINDRSLLGERDSELAVLVMDGANSRADINGQGSQRPVRTFAHELRKDVWRKLFGLKSDPKLAAKELAKAVDEPGHPDSWKAIQKRAKQNAEIYEKAFPWVPRNWVKFGDKPKTMASILPTWDATADAPTVASWGEKGLLTSPMPFEPVFWEKGRYKQDELGALSEQVRGYIVALPYLWTGGEHLHFDFPTALVAENEPANSTGTAASTLAALNKRNGESNT